MTKLCVIGVGNTLMGDDGVGMRIADYVRALLPAEAEVDVVSGGTAGMMLMPHVLGAERVIFIDAIDVGEMPGTVFRMDPDAAGITGLRSTTSHGIGIPYLITNARMLGHRADYLVYGIQIGDVMLGPDTLSEPVARVVNRVALAVIDDLYAAEPLPATGQSTARTKEAATAMAAGSNG